MSSLTRLKAALTLTDVAALLHFKPAGLSYILYKRPAGSNYTKFDIPKRYGGTRPISAPTAELKLVQRRLADLLQDCVAEISVTNRRKDAIAHGFKRKRSIITNATQHQKRRFVFNVDLDNFFGTINFGRVRGFFIKDKNFALNEKVATVLAQIICSDNALPQGSPCSPVVSNLVAHMLDIHLVRLAARTGCTYTRYADDLTFSSNAHLFPESVAKCADQDAHTWVPGQKLESLVRKSGFEINANKTRMQYCRSRQDVTGLTVNRQVNSRKEYRHTVRAMVHRLIKSGVFEFIHQVPDGKGNVVVEKTAGTSDQLRGMLGFIEGVDRHNKHLSVEVKKDRDWTAREATYRRFLFFTEFHAAPRPLLIGEGSTDYVYLLHAIRSLAAGYPQLATTHPAGTITLNTRIYKYPGSSTDRILGIKGGSAHLKNLILGYHNERKRFSAPGSTQPVVLVIDNDGGASPVYSVIQQLTKKIPSGTETFIHVTGNLYVVATPLTPAGTSSKMEDLFDATIKSTVIGGKTFDEKNNTDTATQYGKTVFAHKVVKPNADKIDFSGFKPLLDRIVAVIDEHAKKVAAAAAPPKSGP